jgi:hypothetical protein
MTSQPNRLSEFVRALTGRSARSLTFPADS